MCFQLRLSDMDGTERSRQSCAAASRAETDQAQRQPMMELNGTDHRDSPSDRVTLKKEIGLLSACAIIIGEKIKQLFIYLLLMYVEAVALKE